MGTLTQRRLLPMQQVIGADWEKIFAFGGKVFETIRNNVHPAGALYINGSICPSNEIWVVTRAGLIDVTNNNNYGIIQDVSAIGTGAIKQFVPLNATVWYTWDGFIVLTSGDYINAYFSNTLLNDDCYLNYSGYKMIIP